MNFEVLKRSHLKRNIIVGVVVVAVIAAVVLQFTSAKYRTTQSMPLINGTVNYSLADLNAVAVYIQDDASDTGYSKSDTIPTSGYAFNEEMSYCTVDGEEDSSITLSYDKDSQMLTVTPLTTKGTKCYLYFDEFLLAKDYILLHSKMGNGVPNYFYSSCTLGSNNGGNCNEETVGVYSEVTSKGTTYYWRGNVEDNYVKFADFYWRIIRINEDSTIRLIYDGTMLHANGESSDDRAIGKIAFNENRDGSYYVGYTYTIGSQRPTNSSDETNSTIKSFLENWYSINLLEYDDYIINNPGFCNDREVASGYSWSAQPSNSILYAAYERLFGNDKPTFECEIDGDLYKTKIGLITADEAVYAGMGAYVDSSFSNSNRGVFLYMGDHFWTITPHYSGSTLPTVYFIYSSLSFGYGDTVASTSPQARPVINLRADTQFTGTGTSTDPYVVV